MAVDLLRIVDLETSSSRGEQGLKGVSLNVRRASIVAICGPNGGGKDALCRCLAGLQRPMAGTIIFDDVIIPSENWRAARKGLIVALANNRVFDELTVRENLMCSVPWWSRTDKGEALGHALALFPALKTRLSQAAGTLSGGEQQMVMLARLFLSDPKLVILEEPWLGLAPMLIGSLMERIRMMLETGTSFILTEENPARATQYADAVFELSGGRVRELT